MWGYEMSKDFQIKGLDKLLAQFDQLKDIDVKPSLQKGGYYLQRETQKNHDYINRTGALQANVDTVITDEGAEVVYEQEYAYYVELKMPYIRPAIDEKEDQILKVIKDDLKAKIGEVGNG
jgi:hypothetical protein